MASIVQTPDTGVWPSTTAAARSSSRTAAPPRERVAIPRELLDGGETVILAIKPSLWFVVFEPLRWIAATILILLALPGLSRYLSPGLSPQGLVQAVLLILAVRIFMSVLRWVSRFYVLTNRRVMWIRGVFRADCWGCSLVRITDTRLTAGIHERAVKLATLDFVSDDLPPNNRAWPYVARPEEVHAEVRRAIARAGGSQPQR